jgi:hypothetical protein
MMDFFYEESATYRDRKVANLLILRNANFLSDRLLRKVFYQFGFR